MKVPIYYYRLQTNGSSETSVHIHNSGEHSNSGNVVYFGTVTFCVIQMKYFVTGGRGGSVALWMGLFDPLCDFAEALFLKLKL